MSWKQLSKDFKVSKTISPEGFQTIEEISADIGESLDYTREMVNEMLKAGKAEKLLCKELNAADVLYSKWKYKEIKAKK